MVMGSLRGRAVEATDPRAREVVPASGKVTALSSETGGHVSSGLNGTVCGPLDPRLRRVAVETGPSPFGAQVSELHRVGDRRPAAALLASAISNGPAAVVGRPLA